MHGEVRLKHGEGEDTDRPEIDRRDLRVLLLDSVPDDKIKWGSKVERVQKQDDGMMSVHFTNGCIESGFRLVVGADGARSKARGLVGFLHLPVSLHIYTITYVYIAHIRHAKICRHVLPHQQRITRELVLPNNRVHGRSRELYEHGRSTYGGCHETW